MQNLINTTPAFQTPAVVPTAIIPSLDVAPASLAPLVVRAGEGIFSDYGAFRGFLKLDAQSTNGAFLWLDMEVDPGKGMPPHAHRLEDETFHVLEGRFQIQIGSRIYDAGPGDTVFAPRQVAHSWQCTSEETGHMLILLTPGANFQAYLAQSAQKPQTPTEAMQDPQAIESFMALTERYGVTMLPQGIEGTPEAVAVTKGRFLDLFDHRGTIDVSSADTNDTFALLNMAVDFKGGPPNHLHECEDEAFYIVKGRFRVVLEDSIIEVGEGDVVFAPRGLAHTWQCISEEGGRLLGMVTPGENFETFASEMVRQQLIPPTTPEAVQNLLALGKHHRIQLLPPAW